MSEAVLELTYKCHLRCRFCYCAWHDYPDFFGKELSKGKWVDIVLNLIRSGVDNITLTGGEPLLRAETMKLIKIIATNPLVRHCEIYSSLFPNIDPFLNIMQDSRFRVMTTLQGIKSWSKMTGKLWGLSKWKKQCEKIVASKIRLGISITITKLNLFELERMIRFANSLKPEEIIVNTVVPEGRAKQNPSILLKYEEIEEVYKRVQSFSEICPQSIRMPQEFFCACRDHSLLGSKHYMNDMNCHLPSDFIVLGPDGRQRKCMHTWETCNTHQQA